jgi:XRE family aerobic/anaerobic benzoate catabolism transcriptional regulator
VRDARRRRRLTRASLAVASGVSERFLAQIESGAGNVSLLRLADLARALEVPIVQLLSTPATPGGRRIALIGLRGAGKSTVGALLARRLKVPFVELDAAIESAAGLTIGQIFELHGERYFRRLEREVLSRFVAAGSSAVLATGGGLVTDPESFALLRATCTTVWLSAPPKAHHDRVLAQGDRRPMADNPDAMAELRAILTARRPLYAQAEVTIDTSKMKPNEAARAIAAHANTRTGS